MGADIGWVTLFGQIAKAYGRYVGPLPDYTVVADHGATVRPTAFSIH